MEISRVLIERLKRTKCVKNYMKFFSTYIANLTLLERELSGCKSVLDLGCGGHSARARSTIRHLSKNFYSVGVDLFKPYLLKSKQIGIHDDYILMDVRKLGIRPRSFDAVVALNVLEHLKKEEGFSLMEEMERCARQKVIISTPNGPQYQEAYDENPLQKHQSSWLVKDFAIRGYSIKGIGGLAILKMRMRGGPLIRSSLFLAIILDITRELTYFFPKLDYQLLCIKEVNVN